MINFNDNFRDVTITFDLHSSRKPQIYRSIIYCRIDTN